MVELEERVARLEGRVEEHSRFFESISVKLTLLEDKGDRNRERLEEKIDLNRKELEEKIDLTRRELEEKIDLNRKELEEKIDLTRKELEEKIDLNRKELEEKIELLRRDMLVWFRWIIGIQITTWITVLLAILFK